MVSFGSIMAGIDKAAIIFSIAITIVGAGIAVAGNAADNAPAYTAPAVTKEMSEPEAQNESFGADISKKVKSEDTMMEKETVKIEEEMVMEEAMVEEEMVMEEAMVEEEMIMEEAHEEPAGPTTHTVDIPEGTSVPGCEESNACYLPADITINAGDTVEWVNVDTAAHTVTGGSPANGPSGVFDSSLVIASANYSFTFDDAGSYDYFCMVHPWMLGSVTVN